MRFATRGFKRAVDSSVAGTVAACIGAARSVETDLNEATGRGQLPVKRLSAILSAGCGFGFGAATAGIATAAFATHHRLPRRTCQIGNCTDYKNINKKVLHFDWPPCLNGLP